MLKDEGHDVEIVDVDKSSDDPRLVSWRVNSVPTTVVVGEDGEAAMVLVGVQPRERLLEALDGKPR